MGYFILGYMFLGSILLFWFVPYYLKRKKTDTIDPTKTATWLLGAEDTGVGLILVGILIWPLAVPVWIRSERSAKKEKEKFLTEQKEEEERKQTDPNHGLSMEQKIEKLRHYR